MLSQVNCLHRTGHVTGVVLPSGREGAVACGSSSGTHIVPSWDPYLGARTPWDLTLVFGCSAVGTVWRQLAGSRQAEEMKRRRLARGLTRLQARPRR
jgi:hypothetical protein